MLGKRDNARLDLFRSYSANLALYFPRLAGLFVCPICLRGFCETDVLHGSDLKVDFGHIFPQEIGGTGVVLECRECNGRLNQLGDSELVKLHKQWDAMRPGSQSRPIRGHLETPVGRVGVDVSHSGLHASLKHADPDALKYAIGAMLRGDAVPLKTPQACQKKINVASLHSAHLLFFREFGYGYMTTPGGLHIRELLANAEALSEDAFMSVQVPMSEGLPPSIIYRIGAASMPDREKCLFVALPVADPSPLCQLLFLPGPWDGGGVAFQRIMATAGTWLNGISCHAFDRRIRNQLAAPEYKNALSLAWNGWKPHNIDMTKLMFAIRAEAGDRIDRRIDVEPIAERFGIARAVGGYVQSLAGRGFLVRAPKRGRPHLVRLTERSLVVK